MLEFGDTVYYIDLIAFDKAVALPKDKVIIETETKTTKDGNGNIVMVETYEKSSSTNKEIDVAKYELLRLFIEYIGDYVDENDTSLGAERALENTSLGYKIIFNTLIKQGIIKEK